MSVRLNVSTPYASLVSTTYALNVSATYTTKPLMYPNVEGF